MTSLLDLIREIGISGFLDIAFMFLIVYSILVWFKRTRAAFVVTGMVIIGAAYLAARQLNLALTITVFQGFFAIILIALVVIFQEEIKHFFEQVASRSAIRNLKLRRSFKMPRQEIEILVRTLFACGQDRIGILIVLRGRNPILRHLEGGEDLNGDLSEALLRSIFDPHSAGHDGAVIIEQNKVTQFSCHLPLSKNLQQVQGSGTRHAAALGLSELTDALCLVVSEERGTISVARKGTIREIPEADELTAILEKFYEEVYPGTGSKPLREFFRRNYREKAIAVVTTIVLWFFLVHSSKIEFQTYRVPVNYTNLPNTLVVDTIEPREVEIVISGPQRSFYFLNPDQIKVSLRLYTAHEGLQRKTLSRINLSLPEGLTLESIEPKEVAVRIVPTHTEQLSQGK